MKKVLVVGSGGAGKSTFATRLGRALGLEVIHLDSIYWKPGWVAPTKEEWQKTVENLVERDAWVMDGNYSGTLELRIKACDTMIFLDIARTVCLWRVLKRSVMYRNRSRPDMAEGCAEKMNLEFLEFLRWIWDYPRKSGPKVLALMQKHSHGKQIVRLRSSAEMEQFLKGLESGS